MTETQTSVRAPKMLAAFTLVAALIAGLVPTVWSYFSNRGRAVTTARETLSATAETSRDRIRAFLGEKSAALVSLAANPDVDVELNAVLNPPPPPAAKKRRGEPEVDEDDEEAVAAAEERAKAAADKVLADVYAKAKVRLDAFCKSTKGCKRVIAADGANKIVVSTDVRDKGGTFSGTLVKMAIKTSQPLSLIAKSLTSSVGAAGVVASRTTGKQFVLVGAFDMNELLSGLAKLREPLGSTSRVIVADRGKLPMIGGLPSKQGKALELAPVSRALDGEADVAETLDENETLILAAYRPVGEAGIAVVVTRQVSAIKSSGAPIPWGMAIVVFVISILGAVAVYFRGTMDTPDSRDEDDSPRRGSGGKHHGLDRPPSESDFAPHIWDQLPPGDDGLPPNDDELPPLP